MIRRSGSPESMLEGAVPSIAEGRRWWVVGRAVVAQISVFMSSEVMSAGRSLWAWDISVRVRVRSTRVSRPSVEESRRRLMAGGRTYWSWLGGLEVWRPLVAWDRGEEGFDDGDKGEWDGWFGADTRR